MPSLLDSQAMKTNTSPKTKVLFRKWHNGDVIALFPEVPSDTLGHYCSSYERIGQHGAANTDIVSQTRPANVYESEALHNELTGIGYDLQVITRVPSNARSVRLAAINQTMGAV